MAWRRLPLDSLRRAGLRGRLGIELRGARVSFVAALVFAGCATRTAHPVHPDESFDGIACACETEAGGLAGTSAPGCVDRLAVGRELAPSRGGGLVHRVHPGETLLEIALRYRVSVSAICRLNCIQDPDRISVDQRLRLPAEATLTSRSSSPSTAISKRAQQLLAEAEEHYQAARFESALENSEAAEALLARHPDQNPLRARAAFVAASALVGLGEVQRATQQFARVHALDTRFDPPAGWLSPRLGALYGRAAAD